MPYFNKIRSLTWQNSVWQLLFFLGSWLLRSTVIVNRQRCLFQFEKLNCISSQKKLISVQKSLFQYFHQKLYPYTLCPTDTGTMIGGRPNFIRPFRMTRKTPYVQKSTSCLCGYASLETIIMSRKS